MTNKNLIKATGCILTLTTLMTSSGIAFAEKNNAGEIQGIVIDSMPQSNSHDLSKEEYELYLKTTKVETRAISGLMTVQKYYTSKVNIPSAIDYSEYKDGYWWSGVLSQTGSVTVDSETGHYMAKFTGRIYRN